MEIQKLVLTEADGTTVETLSTTTGFQTVVGVQADGTQVQLFPVSVPTATDPVVQITTKTQSGVTISFIPELG